MAVMIIDYDFSFDGKNYQGTGKCIGETCSIELEKNTDHRIDAICDAFKLDINELEEKLQLPADSLFLNDKNSLDNLLKDFDFNYSELR